MTETGVLARYEIGGLLRCCAASLPINDKEQVVAGKDGEHRPCQWCKDKATSGVRFTGGRWIAAWRKE